MIHHRDTLKEISGDLIKHLLGFQPGDPNFNRSIQYVCSNLFYHRCLSPEPRQLQEQVDGVLLKLAVHGRAGNRDRLEKLVKEWTAIPEAHEQRELRWSLLCLLLELSYNPTSHHVSPSPSSNHHVSPSPSSNHHISPSPSSNHQVSPLPSSNHVSQWPAETQRSGSRIEANLLQQLLPDTLPPLLPDEPLSDWSDADDEPEDGNTKNLEFDTAAGNVNFLPHVKSSSVTSTLSSSHASTCEPSVSQSNTATHDKSRVGNGVSVTATDSKASQPVISNEAEALICDNLSSAELLKEASRARQWLDANTRQTIVDCYGVERVSEEELVIRLLQSLFCPSLFRSLLDQTPATPTLNQERVESVLQKNFRPMIEKLEDIEKTFTGLYARKNIGIEDFCGEKTALHTEEKLNSNSAFHELGSDYRRNSNVGVKIPYECSAKSSLREAFIAALSEWQARVYQKLEEFVNFVRDGSS
ncbi:uncharacterized protein LOC108672324 [Hyalella azteca]|uniref:Uncharacterized protein LOC108672324 n=1 Tax=Hyalella azteca TaxID=294128 RepID=A0A8B7NP61_HYAAZ|nr:uncharacterized protein LOC108672324 [Hyalella azteca]